MSLEEKHWWTYAAIALVVPAIYFTVVLVQAARTPVDAIQFQVPLLTAGLVGVLLSVVATVAIRVAAPKGAPRIDQRDRDIHRFGEYVAGIVLLAAMAVPFALVMLEADHFWIANGMYLAVVLSALAGSAAKLVIYRRGF